MVLLFLRAGGGGLLWSKRWLTSAVEGEKATEEENPLGYLHLLKISKNAHTHTPLDVSQRGEARGHRD